MGKIDVIQLRILIKRYFCRAVEKLCPVVINGKKNLLSRARIIRIFCFNKSFSRRSKNPKCPAGVFVSQKFGGIPDVLTQYIEQQIPFFFSFGICRFNGRKKIHVFGINDFDGSFQIRFHTIFGFFRYVSLGQLLGTWSRSSERSGIWVSVVSEGSWLISITWVNIQDEPRRVKSVGTLAV